MEYIEIGLDFVKIYGNRLKDIEVKREKTGFEDGLEREVAENSDIDLISI